MIITNITVDIVNNEEATMLSIKSTTEDSKVLIKGDPSLYEIKEIEEALNQVKKFIERRKVITEPERNE